LGGHTLTVNGSLNFNVNESHLTTTVIRNGVLAVSSPFGNVYVGRAVNQNASADVHLGGLSQFTAEVARFHVATYVSRTPYGQITLAQTNTIDADEIMVGEGMGTGYLHLGQTNTILADNFIIAKDHSNGTVHIAAGGTLELGSTDRRTWLPIADQDNNTNSSLNGRIELTDAATLNAYLSGLIVARKFGGRALVNAVDFGLVRDNATNPLMALKLIEKGTRFILPERPGGCFAQNRPGLFFVAEGRSSKVADPATAAVQQLLATL